MENKYKLNDSQMGVYLDQINDADTTKYNIPVVKKFSINEINVDKLLYSMKKAILDSDVVHYYFKEDDGIPTMFKEEKINIEIPHICLKEEEVENALHSFVKPFDLSKPVLVHAQILETIDNIYMCIDYHHIISDGTSMKLLIDRILDIYYDKKTVKEEMTLTDEIECESKETYLSKRKSDEEYFIKKLDGLNIDSNLVVDLKDNEIDNKIKSIKKELDIPYTAFDDLAKKYNVTKGNLFISAFAYALAKSTCQQESLFCTVSSGRHTNELNNTMGMFVRTFPYYQRFNEEDDISSCFLDAKKEMKEDVIHDSASFAKLANELDINADILFTYQGRLFNHMSMIDKNDAQANLAVYIFNNNNNFEITIEYRSSLYLESSINRFISLYENILKGFLTCKRLCDIKLITTQDSSLLESFNKTEHPISEDETVLTLFKKQVEKNPDNIAVVYEKTKYTYKQVDDLSSKVATNLLKNGIKKGDFVSILLSRCAYMPITALGVMKIGAIYQPLDSTYPIERLNFMVNDCKAKYLITEKKLENYLTEYNGGKLLVEDIDSLKKEDINIKVNQEDPYIILYTSGTTGTPKGVLLRHQNLINHIIWHTNLFSLNENSHYLAYASFGFDANMMDTYPILASGGQLHILSEEIRLDFPKIDEYCKENEITDCFMTTQVGRQFILFTTCKTLKHMAVGGETLVPLNPPKNVFFYNIYGPTECTIYNTCYQVTNDSKILPIGKPTYNTKLYVVDKFSRLLPIGCCGELCISGVCVGNGYLNREEATKKAFTSNPFSNEKGYERLYHTGDIVRYLKDGNIEFIGRRDSQVKIRGFRIELSEVEGVIREYKGIKDATVVAYDAPSGGKYVAGYIVSDEKINIDDLNNFILERKPPYMVPEVTMQIDKIPLNQNQKVNKRALPKPEIKENEDETSSLNDLEKEISKVIKEILQIDVKNINSHLSKYGLTSISSIRLAAVLFKKYQIEFKNRELISSGTIKLIEDRILSKKTNIKSEEKKDEKIINSTPLTFSQQGVYAECIKNPSLTQYNIPFVLKIPNGINEETLKESIEKVVSSHPSMHILFKSNADNEIVQEEIPCFKPKIETLTMNDSEYEQFKNSFVKPFDLAKGNLMRFAIVLHSNETHLFMDFHHLIMDGSSVDLFVRQLSEVLDGKEIEKEEYTYFDYGKDQKIDKEDEEFFENNMVVEEASRLIPDIFEKDLPSKEKTINLPTSLNDVFSKAKVLEVSPASIYLAATYIATSRFLYEDSIGIATISSGRSNLKIQNTTGMFVNTLPLTMKIDSSLNCDEFIKQVSEHFSLTISHENYPFSKTASKFDFRPSISYAYQVGVLNEYKTKYGILKLEPLELNVAKIPVSIFINQDENGNGLISLAYDSSLYSEKMMMHYATSIENVLHGLLNEKTLKNISLTNEEDDKVLDSYNPDWDLNYDKNDTAVTLFKKKVNEHPDKLACVYKDKKYTYKQLDELTDSLSKIIYQRVSENSSDDNEKIIAILSGRNENTFILPLSVLKAGYAYQPLDPSYPKKRLNFMVKDANISLLLSQDDLREILDEFNGDTILFSDLFKMNVPSVTPKESKPESCFIMLYTSGSTGLPKGVQIEHRNLIAYAHGTCKANYYTPDCVTAAYASFGFDVNMADTFCTLLNGGTLHLIDEDIRMNLDQLAKYFDDNGVTQCLMTTQVGVQFVLNHPKMKTLRYLTLGGEKLPSVDPSKLTYQLNNGYGPTENCCGVSLFPVQHWEANIPIGKPMSTIHGYILDKTNHRLPAGAAGEYCLSGPMVSRGYLNQPEKTAQSYQQCPFNEFRMYHTGDVVRYREDGNVEFVGRKDGQVKIRGFRIETKEIESVIRQFEGVKDTTVQAYSYESGGKYLAAFVVYEKKLDIKALNKFLHAKLPNYMIPTVIMQLDKIPLTVNQKVDKKALPQPQVEKKEYVAPENKSQKDVADTLSEILGIEKVSLEDDFFELGGSSISAMKVVISLSKKGYQVVYQDIFDHSSVRDLASFISNVESEKTEKKENITIEKNSNNEISSDGYNYHRINELLSKNTLQVFKNGERNAINDVLLIGATGFLGCHVLKELTKNSSRTIYCLVREKKNQTALERLKEYVHYYHSNSLDELFDKQIKVIQKDITDEHALDDFNIDNITVINCAASVKHFAKDDEIERTNTKSVNNLISYCIKHNCRLIHVSTESVMGSLDANNAKGYKLTESKLFQGQIVDNNQYVHSKFMAERAIYEAILDKNLKAKVMRVGNLSPRYSDGKFQINYESNSFMKNLSAYQVLGMIPYSQMDSIAEFSPIDKVAESILLLATTPDDCICFMPSNQHFIHIGDVLMQLSKNNPIKMVEDDEFVSELNVSLSDKEKSEKVSTLLVYQGHSKENDVRMLGVENLDNSYTIQILYRLGFSWPITDEKYVDMFSSRLRELKFFK